MLAQWTIVILSLALCVVLFPMTFSFPHIPSDPGGMALFPRAIMAILVCSIGVFILGLSKKHVGKRGPVIPFHSLGSTLMEFYKATGDSELALKKRLIYVIILSVAYPWVILKVGFVIATMVYIIALMKLYKNTRTVTCLLYSIIVTGVVYGFFVLALDAYIPPGEWLQIFFD
jgi:hypothetical protein